MRARVLILILSMALGSLVACGRGDGRSLGGATKFGRYLTALESQDSLERSAGSADLVFALMAEHPVVSHSSLDAPVAELDDLTKTIPSMDRVLHAVLRGTRDEEVTVRGNCASAIGLIGAASEKVVRTLIACLDDDHSRVRHNATASLQHLASRLLPWRDLILHAWAEANTLERSLPLGLALLRISPGTADVLHFRLDERIRAASAEEIEGAVHLFDQLGREFMTRKYPTVARTIREMGGDI